MPLKDIAPKLAELALPERPARLLLIDNDSVSNLIVTEILSAPRYHVEIAGSVVGASALLEEIKFDLVLVEIAIEQGGLALLDQLCLSQLPVLVITSLRKIDLAIGALRAGAADYLLKPVDPSGLRKAVERALERGRALRRSQLDRRTLEEEVTARTAMLLRAIEELEHSYDVTLEALGDALDMKDSETQGHSRRVTAYTVTLARAMSLPSAEIKMIARGAFLHDIGKMAIPDRILLKPGKLSVSEQQAMREHCTLGYQVLRKIPFLAESAEIVLSHQEHFDGSGYPRGLRGEEIPLGARIFAVADALDAITSDRPYRQGRSFTKARIEISRCAGSQFDPRVVEVFNSIPIELWQDLRSEITGRQTRFSSFDLASLAGFLAQSPSEDEP